jgi:hypothetical protein
MPEPTPEAWAQIRYDYEHTDKPIVEICFEHEITAPMLRYRVKCWDWTRRKPFVPRHGPPPVDVIQPELATSAAPVHPAPPALANAAAGDPPPPGEGKESKQARPGWEGEGTIVPQLQSAVARVLPAIEATIARLASGTLNAGELEKAGRTLGALTRTLRELNGLLAQHNARGDDMRCECREMSPEDIDAFRDNLARRINAFVASRSKEGAQPGSALPLDAQK